MPRIRQESGIWRSKADLLGALWARLRSKLRRWFPDRNKLLPMGWGEGAPFHSAFWTLQQHGLGIPVTCQSQMDQGYFFYTSFFPRTVLQQSHTCLGSWVFPDGTTNFALKTSEDEFWETGKFHSSHNRVRCWSMDSRGEVVGEGFHNSCTGIGGELTPQNGIRRLRLSRSWKVRTGTLDRPARCNDRLRQKKIY